MTNQGACEYGYTAEQVKQIMGKREPDFKRWMMGSTMALCPEHGAITYRVDVERFLAGRRQDDVV